MSPYRSSLRPIGSAKRREIKATSQVRREFLSAHPGCQVGLILHENSHRHPTYLKAVAHCTGTAQGVHERQKRSAGGSLTDEDNLLSACNRCNGWVEERPILSRILGLTVLSWENPEDIPKGFRIDMKPTLDTANRITVG